MKCSQCGQAVPEGAPSCPRCTGGEAPSGRQAMQRGALAGGLKGLFLGLLPMVVLLMEYRAEPGITLIALALPVASFAIGAAMGLLKARKERA